MDDDLSTIQWTLRQHVPQFHRVKRHDEMCRCSIMRRTPPITPLERLSGVGTKPAWKINCDNLAGSPDPGLVPGRRMGKAMQTSKDTAECLDWTVKTGSEQRIDAKMRIGSIERGIVGKLTDLPDPDPPGLMIHPRIRRQPLRSRNIRNTSTSQPAFPSGVRGPFLTNPVPAVVALVPPQDHGPERPPPPVPAMSSHTACQRRPRPARSINSSPVTVAPEGVISASLMARNLGTVTARSTN